MYFQKFFCWYKKVTEFLTSFPYYCSSHEKDDTHSNQKFSGNHCSYLIFGVCLQTSEILVIALLSSIRCCTVLWTAGTIVKFLDVQSIFSFVQIQPPGQSWKKSKNCCSKYLICVFISFYKYFFEGKGFEFLPQV